MQPINGTLLMDIIKFDDPALLVGGAKLDQALLSQFPTYPLVAADGGSQHLSNTARVPDMIIGDMDSIADKHQWSAQTRLLEIAEQDTTDFEKCLYSIAAPYYIALGFCGGRLDHTLAALHVMQKYHKKLPGALVGEEDITLVCSASATVTLPINTRVSIYPLGRTSFSASSGLLYPLHNLTMEAGEFIGTSNMCSASKVSIVPASGCFALILPIDQLDAALQMLKAQSTLI